MKRIIITLLVVALAISSSVLVYADADMQNVTVLNEKVHTSILASKGSPDASIQQYSACPSGNGIHKMKRRGCGDICVGEFGNATCVLRDGCCWQCTKCYEVIITENDPLNGLDIGIYATAASLGPVSPYNTIIFVSGYKICRASHLDGFSFSYA